MELSTEAMRMEFIANGKRGIIYMKQPKGAPYVHINKKTQYEFKHLDDADNTAKMEWRTGAVKRASDRTNLLNTSVTRPKTYRKSGAVEIEWLADEEVSYYVIEIKKYFF